MDSFILPRINFLWFSVFQAILAENKEKLPVAINAPVYAKDKVFKYVSTNKTFSYQDYVQYCSVFRLNSLFHL